MTRAPTYPIHRNRRNSISIRFSVRSIRFSRCGPGPVGPRPPASLALGGKEIHYPPRGAESRGSFRTTGPPQPGGGEARAFARRRDALRDGQRPEARAGRKEGLPPCRGGPRCGGAGPCAGWGACMHARIRGRNTPAKAKSPRVGPGARRGAARRRPPWREKAPCASEAPYPPAAWRCSTFGDGGLNCRGRNGIG